MDGGEVVIGTEMAAARVAEQRHRAQVTGSSPLSGVSYRGSQELELLQPVPCVTDDVVGSLVERYATLDPAAREGLRALLTMDDLYTLLHFARRAAALSLRSRNHELVRRGVFALSIVDRGRIDWRDLSWASAIDAYVVQKLDGDALGAFMEAAEAATPATAEVLERFGRNPPSDLAEWGYREVETSSGTGLVRSEGAHYASSADLLMIAAALSAGLSDNHWELGEPTTGTTLPKVWLRYKPPKNLDKLLDSFNGCVSLRGVPSAEMPEASAQMMLVWIGEAPDAKTAERVAGAAGPGSGSSFAGFGVAANKLFAVIISRSFIKGRPSFESQSSLARFRPALTAALRGGQMGR